MVEPCWSLAVTLARAEFTVAKSLVRLDVRHRLFKVRRELVHRGRLVERLDPAFPGYVFVAPCNRWDAIREIGGLTGFVHFDGLPAQVPPRVIDELAARADADDVLPMSATVPAAARFTRGQRVRIIGSGAACGCDGRFQRYLGDGLSIVLLDWLGRWAPTSIDERDLEPFFEEQPAPGRKRRRRRRYKGRVAGLAEAAA